MKLDNSRLLVQFAPQEAVKTQRFDRTAMVEQVTLDGKYTFCTQEQLLPQRRTTFGFGLCGEFVLEGAAEEAAAGEWFAKPGVGLLRQKEDGMPWDMWQHYDCRPFPVSVRQEEEKRTFCQSGEAENGYGFRIEKTFFLRNNALVMEVAVCNIGEKSAVLKEYQHNFLSLNAQPVGPGYRLEIPCDGNLSQIVGKTLRQGDEASLPGAVCMEGQAVCWTQDMDQKIVYHSSRSIRETSHWGWKLSFGNLSATEELSVCPSRVDVWSIEHCVSPELYCSAVIAPGQTARWRRTWTFDAENGD